VGRTVIQALRAEGYVVRCLVRRGSERDLRGVGAIERVEGDVLSPQTLEEGMAGCDAVVHLVGIIREHVPTNTTFYRVHVQGTSNVVAAAASVGVRRYIHMSALGAREGARSRYHQNKWAAADPEVQRAPSRRAGGDARPPPTALFPAHARPAPDARRGQRLRSGAVLLDVRVGAAAARDGPAPAARMTTHSSFSTSLRRDSGQPRDLAARVEAELRERIEEAVDFA